MSTEGKQKIVSPVFQIVLIALGFLIISYALYLRFKRFHTEDAFRQVLPITVEKQKEFGQFSSKVNTGLFIKEFERFDIVKNEFIFSGTLWFSMVSGSVSEKTIGNFSFENSEILQKSEPIIKIFGDHIFMSYDIKVKFSSPVSFKNFPVDDHRLYLKLMNKLVLPGEISFVSNANDFKIGASTIIWGWRLFDKYVETGYSEDKLSVGGDKLKTSLYPTVLFSMYFEQKDFRNTLTILLPLLLTFYISLFGFSVKGDEMWKLPLTGLTITVSYRFVMETLSPKVGYFMASDYLYLCYLAVSCTIFVFNMLNIKYLHANRAIKTGMVVLFQVFIVLSNIYFLSG